MDDGRIQTEGTPQEVIQSGEIDRVFNIRTHLFTEGDQTFYHFSKTTV
jgi:ABC-type cobalamin/Fe3+-siderophores transport system ATPase subunit